jgi:hypothetical protein
LLRQRNYTDNLPGFLPGNPVMPIDAAGVGEPDFSSIPDG